MTQVEETTRPLCANGCGKDVKKKKYWQRFCSPSCRAEFHKVEAQKAREAWRKSNSTATSD